MTVRTALRTSSNRAAVRMLEEVGIAKTVVQARKMGLGNVPGVPSLALGSGEVTLMAMTSAYASFADQGLLHPASFIRRVEDAKATCCSPRSRQPSRSSPANRVSHDEHARRCRELRNGL